MATDLGKAYVQIVPSAQGISGSISKLLGGESASAGKSAGNNIVGNIVSTIKKMIPAAAIGKLLFDSIQSGAALEQSYIGGLDTLYGDAADKMRECAIAAAEAGISANSYAEQAVSFGAALKQSFGDAENAEQLAGEAANLAILDMADNAAKMGTDLSSIQNAYQGFAKQNYTMLDNLKLGYGGTKTEMQRLLKDAQKLTGVKYDINNLADVYSAIHVIQKDLGIAGVAADEASTTLSGSFGAMKAAAENFLGSLALGENVAPALSTLVSSASTFLFDNLIPAVANVLSSLPDAIGQAITEFAPQLGEKALDLITRFCEYLYNNFPAMIQSGLEMIRKLTEGFPEAFPDLVLMVTDVVLKIGETIWDNMDTILQIGVDIIEGLIRGILSAAGRLIEALVNTVKGAFNKAKEWLGIASPSKKFEWIGKMTGEGLALGLSESGNDVKRAMNGLLDPLNTPSINGSVSLSSTQPYGRALVINFSIDNSGKDITDQDVRRWCGMIDEALGGAV